MAESNNRAQAEREAAIDLREAGGEDPPPPADPGEVAGARSLTEEAVYGRPDLGPADDAPDPSDSTSGAPEGQQSQAGEPEPERPAANRVAQEPAAGQEPSRPKWDPKRQRTDQDNANLRKDNDGLRDDNAQLRDRLGTVETRIEEVAAGQARPGEQTDQELKDLVELDEFATDEDRNKAVNELIRRDGLRNKQGKARDEAIAATTDEGRNRTAFDEILAKGEQQYGREHRNEVVTRVRKLWRDSGFNETHYPDPASTTAAVMGIFAEVAAEAKGKPRPGPAPPRTGTPAHDPGGGGRPAQSRQDVGMESLDEVIDDMTAKGQLRRG